jgi:hypothetical protein
MKQRSSTALVLFFTLGGLALFFGVSLWAGASQDHGVCASGMGAFAPPSDCAKINALYLVGILLTLGGLASIGIGIHHLVMTRQPQLPRFPRQQWAPGWYPDPSGNGLRWWNGQQWTEHTT